MLVVFLGLYIIYVTISNIGLFGFLFAKIVNKIYEACCSATFNIIDRLKC